jgi:hypothetical protein
VESVFTSTQISRDIGKYPTDDLPLSGNSVGARYVDGGADVPTKGDGNAYPFWTPNVGPLRVWPLARECECEWEWEDSCG